MRRIIDNLTRQHRDLVKTATRIFGWLDEQKLQRGAQSAYDEVSSLSGILKVHLAMEDRSLYPRLLQHPEAQMRALARRFLDERHAIRQRFEDYRALWSSAAAIVGSPAAFVDDTRLMLGMLWSRMKLEDDVFHPEIIRLCD